MLALRKVREERGECVGKPIEVMHKGCSDGVGLCTVAKSNTNPRQRQRAGTAVVVGVQAHPQKNSSDPKAVERISKDTFANVLY